MNLTPDQADILRELMNIGVGRAAGMLNEMTDAYVRLQVPSVRIFSALEFKKEMEREGVDRLAAVRLGFKGPFFGTADLVFLPESASKLVAVLTGEEPGTREFDSVRAGTLNELGNIIISGVMGSMGNLLEKRIEYSLPQYIEDTIENLLKLSNANSDGPILLVRTHFVIEQLQIEGDIMLIFEVGSFDALLAAIDAIDTWV
jgi:chemotaxis protein CheC